jgi:hypothetical protein
MIAMDQTIAGAASGETAGNLRRRRVHNLRQKDRRVRVLFVILMTDEIGEIPISFFMEFNPLFISSQSEQRKLLLMRGQMKWHNKN